jgi:hypothetical protein
MGASRFWDAGDSTRLNVRQAANETFRENEARDQLSGHFGREHDQDASVMVDDDFEGRLNEEAACLGPKGTR